MVCALATAILFSGYDSVEIVIPLEDQWITSATICADGSVAGSAQQFIAYGPHSGSSDRPFHWKGGKTFMLPVPEGDGRGHVYDATEKCLVGNAALEAGWYPAMWTPDPDEGWAKAKCTLLTKEPGFATQIDSNGTIWIDAPEYVGRYQNGKLEKIPAPNFDLSGVDNEGRIFGTFYDGIGYHEMREGEVAGYIHRGKQIHLSEKKQFGDRIYDITPAGKVLICGLKDFLWEEGTLNEVPELEPGQRFHPRGMGESGTLFGTVGDGNGKSFPALLDGEKVTSLEYVVDGVILDEIEELGAQGQVVAKSGQPNQGKERTFLLTPKKLITP